VQTTDGSYHRGDRVDPLWVMSIAALAWASWLHPSGLRSVRLDPWWELLVPGVAVTAAVAVLVYGNVHPLPTVPTAVAAAARLADRAMPDETVVRLGGDEFAVVVPDVAGPEAAIAAADRIRTAFDAPITVDGVTLHLSASAGIALAPEHGREPTTLLRRADVA